MPSLKVVKPFISQNKIVISRREPLASVSSGRSISPATIRGSTYLPNVSRICALIRSSPTMLLKDCVSRPISSREVIGTTVSSAPPSTAAVPASRRRTGRTRPRVTAAATVMPSNAAIASVGIADCHELQRQANLDNMPLIGAGSDDGGTGEPTHLAPRGINLVVEVVPPIVQF